MLLRRRSPGAGRGRPDAAAAARGRPRARESRSRRIARSAGTAARMRGVGLTAIAKLQWGQISCMTTRAFATAVPFLPTHNRCYRFRRDAGWSSQVARRAHNPEVAGSNPAPATHRKPASKRAFGFLGPASAFDAGSSAGCGRGAERIARRGGYLVAR